MRWTETVYQRLRKEKADSCSAGVGDPAVLFSSAQSVSVVASPLVWASTRTGSTKQTGLLLFTSSIPLKSESFGGSELFEVSVFLCSPASCSLFIWELGAVLLPCVNAISSDGMTGAEGSLVCPEMMGMVTEAGGWSEDDRLTEDERPIRSNLGFVTQPSNASNCLRS